MNCHVKTKLHGKSIDKLFDGNQKRKREFRYWIPPLMKYGSEKNI